MSEHVKDLTERIQSLQQQGGSARERILALLDEGSFVEMGAFAHQRSTDFLSEPLDTPADGVICGHGYINGRLAYLYSQNNAVLGGSIGEIHAKKIKAVYKDALKMGAPVIGIIDSKGIRLNENVDALNAFGTIFSSMSKASGVVPQVSIILGPCIGGMSFIPALSDFVFMTEKDALLFLSSPNSIPGSEGRTTTFDGLGGGMAHSKNSGLVHFVGADETAVFGAVKQLMDYLPSNNMEESIVMPSESALSRKCPELDAMCDSDAIDAKKLIEATADQGQYFELYQAFAPAVTVGFARFNGFTAGIVANNGDEGLLCNHCMSKAISFINFCDSFNIPLLTFTNVKGFRPSVAEEHNGIIMRGAELMHAFCSASVPKINIIVGSAFGSAYIIMNSKHIGADAVFAWPNAKISVMDANAAVSIMLSEDIKSADDSLAFRDEKIKEYDKMQSSPYVAASRGYVDAVIVPSETRDIISDAIETLSSKRVMSPSRKHSSFK